MARREGSGLHSAAGEEWIAAEKKRVGPLVHHCYECGADFLTGPGVEDLAYSNRASFRPYPKPEWPLNRPYVSFRRQRTGRFHQTMRPLPPVGATPARRS